MGWNCSSSLELSKLDTVVYGFRGTRNLSRSPKASTEKLVQVSLQESNDAGNSFLEFMSLPEMTLSICHFLGTASSKDYACVSHLSKDAVSAIMHFLKTLLPARICVIGGRVGMKALDVIQAYDPVTSTWEVLKPMQSCRNGCGAVVCHDQLYTMGGRSAQGKVLTDVQRYNPAKDQWVDLPKLQVAREKFACAQIGGGIYIAGGWAGAAGSLASAEYFDPNSSKWTSLPPLPEARYACAGVAMHGCLFVVGGLDSADEPRADVYVYVPGGKWTSLPPMPTPRFDCAVAGIGSKIVVIAGRNNYGQTLDTVECFDLTTGTWETLPPLVAPRFGCCASTSGDKLYVFGGWDTDAVSRIEELDFSKENLEWNSSLPSMPTARGGCAVTILRQ